jgi:hypothetical protein
MILDLCVQEERILVGVKSVGKAEGEEGESNWVSMNTSLESNMILKIRQIHVK